MFKKVIVGVDPNPSRWDAVLLARQLMAPGGELSLAHVHRGFARPAGPPTPSELSRREQAEGLLAKLADESGITRLRAVGATSVASGLRDLTEYERADLLVLGSSSGAAGQHVAVRDEFNRSLSGATCAIAIAPAGYVNRTPRFQTVGVGHNGSDEAQAALATARAIAAHHHASLAVCRAVPRLPSAPDTADDAATVDNARLERAIAELTALGDVEISARHGDPGSTLIAFSNSLDLLVIGSRSHGPLGRLAHGSTTLTLAHGCRCPLLIVPRRGAAYSRVLRADTVITIPGSLAVAL